MSNNQQIVHSVQSTNLADILERVLDKGIVIAGDIQIKLADVELLTIKIRLLIASVDKAQQIGINWWERDSYLSSKAKDLELSQANAKLTRRIESLEEKLSAKVRLRAGKGGSASPRPELGTKAGGKKSRI